MKASNLQIHDQIKQNLVDRLEINYLTEIQKQVIPRILKGESTLSLSPSGTGKTLAFLVPAIEYIVTTPVEHNDPMVLIVTPTSELAWQIFTVAKSLTNNLDVPIFLLGGRDNTHKTHPKEDRIELVIGTPGNILTSQTKYGIDYSKTGIIVIDECDMLLDLGFSEEIEAVTGLSKEKNVSVNLFSATLPPEMFGLANKLLKHPVKIEIKHNGFPKGLSHYVYEVQYNEKKDKLLQILSTEAPVLGAGIIFAHSQETSRTLTKLLLREGLDVEELHAGLSKVQRLKALRMFENQEVQLLVATDLAARGIDLPHLTHVINFEVPRNIETYIHRVGRTARMNNKGKAITIVSPKELHLISKIEKETEIKMKILERLPEHIRLTNIEKYKERKKQEKQPLKKRKRSGLNKSWFKNSYKKFNPKQKRKHKKSGRNIQESSYFKSFRKKSSKRN